MRSGLLAVLAVLGSLATLPLLVGTTFPGFQFLIVPIVALTVVVGYAASLAHRDVPWLLPALVAVGAGFALYSLVTGVANGLSDEPYSTPAFAPLGLAMYSRSVAIHYVQYGTPGFIDVYDVYLPLLTYIQVPGLDYRWVSLVAWGGTLYLVRGRPLALAGFSAAWVPLLAANGQNDFVPLLAVTLALVVPLGRYGPIAEAFSLGLKQWANLLVFAFHLARREYWRAALALAVTAAILAPFVLVNAAGVYCHVLVGNSGTSCTASPWTFFVFKRNYWLYPTWAIVVFYAPLRDGVIRLGRRLGAFRGPSLTGEVRAPASLR
jgi:hypothetical protein